MRIGQRAITMSGTVGTGEDSNEPGRDTVASMQKESELALMFLDGNKWPVEQPELCVLGKWIEFGRKLRSASDGEILSLIASVEIYLENKLDDETLPDPNYREYVRGYAKRILKAARAELTKRNLGAG